MDSGAEYFLHPDQVAGLLDRMNGRQVLVVGDLMIDEYLWGTVDRISPEAPVQVVDIQRESYTLGGAGNVVQNLVDLGARVSVVGIIGGDLNGRMLRELFDKLQIDASGLYVDPQRPTSKKTRIIAVGQQILRIDRETRQPITEEFENLIIRHVQEHISSYQAIILSDYGKGILTREVTQEIIAVARTHQVPLLVDPKGRDYSKYAGATLITPNQREAETASHYVIVDNRTLTAAGEYFLREYDLQGVVITRSEKGIALFERDQAPVYLSTKAREVFDVTGAGDTVISVLGLGLAAGLPLIEACYLANAAAGIVVGKVGTATTNSQEIVSYLLEHSHASQAKIVSWLEIKKIVEDLKDSGKKVVFTNGCFDILHVGHIKYLQKARELGDALVLGLNSDASVRRLKGEKRPLMNQDERAHVLAALDCVDHIVIFDEDTPQNLLEMVRPHILAKGGDYTANHVVGRELVESYGGRVEIIPFIEGKSTTSLINHIVERFK